MPAAQYPELVLLLGFGNSCKSFDTAARSVRYDEDITEEGGGPVEMNSGSDCSIQSTREVADS